MYDYRTVQISLGQQAGQVEAQLGTTRYVHWYHRCGGGGGGADPIHVMGGGGWASNQRAKMLSQSIYVRMLARSTDTLLQYMAQKSSTLCMTLAVPQFYAEHWRGGGGGGGGGG